MSKNQTTTCLDIHADAYVTFRRIAGQRYRLSVMLHARQTADNDHWRLRSPAFEVALECTQAVVAVAAKADNGHPQPSRGVQCAAEFADTGLVPHTYAGVMLDPLPSGGFAYAEFDLELGGTELAGRSLAGLRISQDFGIHRLHGAAAMMVGLPLMLDSGKATNFGAPCFSVLCDDAEDGDPDNEGYAADELHDFTVYPVLDAEGSCSHDWCLGTHEALVGGG